MTLIAMAAFELKYWELLCYCLIFLIGLIGNFLVCVVFFSNGPTYRNAPFNVYLMGLATTDLILAIVCLPIYVMSTSAFDHPTRAKGTVFCKCVTSYLLPFWLGGASVYILVFISFERYRAMRYPLKSRTGQSCHRIWLNIAASWLIGFVIQLPTVLSLKRVSSGETPNMGNYCLFSWNDETLKKEIFAAAFAFQYGIPAILFMVNFFRIRQCLGKLDENLKRSFGDDRFKEKLMENRKKSVRIVFLCSATFFLCWTPNNILYFLFQYEGKQDNTSWNTDPYQVGIVLGYFNSCMNPILYAFQSKEFRQNCKKALKRMFKKPDKTEINHNAIRNRTVSTENTLTTKDKKQLLKYAV